MSLPAVLQRTDLMPNVQAHVTVQDYSAQPKIADVKIIDLKVMTDDGGYFLELNRWTQGIMTDFPEFQLAQMNYSEMEPGVVKAWHLHFKQEDIWFVPPRHKVLVALHDCRATSPTQGQTMRFVLGGGRGRLVYIPRGVAHGAANLWSNPASIIYLVNNQFSAEAATTDEQRLPWDHFGAELWNMTKG